MQRRAWAGAIWLSATILAAAGCLVVAPLEDLPEGMPGGRSAAGGVSGKAGGGSGKAGGGSGGAGGCSSNADCAERGAGEPYLCQSSMCVPVKTEECPLVYGDASDPQALVFGAFATLSSTVPERNSIVYAHRLALQELSGDNLGGLPDGPDGARRPLVMVVCNNLDERVEAGLAHLVEDLGVKAVLATLKPGDLRRGFEKHTKNDVFYLSPVPVTEPVATLNDEDLVWNMLGQPSDLAPAYAGLLRRLEPHVRATHGVDADADIRVAMVTTLDAFDAELANAVTPALVFNDQPLQANKAAGNFALFTATSSEEAHLLELTETMLAFKPHIIVSAASEVMTLPTTGIITNTEAAWESFSEGQALPTYVLSPYNAGALDSVVDVIDSLLEFTLEAEPQQRFVGVSIASAEDRRLQFAYETRLGSLFKGAYADSANYYDAVYFLAYAIYGAGTEQPLSGSTIAAGMKRLLEGRRFDVGPNDIIPTFAALADGASTITLNSTLGPPTFDAETGVRQVDGSVFCFKRDAALVTYEIDALRYDRTLEDFRDDGNFCFTLVK